ncbi:hypothetical protein [Tepidimonas charontis]|uniref:Uncharacterized protein n=1 Tax=Tepidimonas charontis TaxID=2267262 RepID=A0A554X108_9BURK|nr:hypothetical protein [Tepidimonas charontis]MCX7693455.1 hypothetical protein [Tepidimonas taiwanensis]TSE29485.1 hypothetical protein Tchar_02573 [Tepidimonas charontis]
MLTVSTPLRHAAGTAAALLALVTATAAGGTAAALAVVALGIRPTPGGLAAVAGILLATAAASLWSLRAAARWARARIAAKGGAA